MSDSDRRITNDWCWTSFQGIKLRRSLAFWRDLLRLSDAGAGAYAAARCREEAGSAIAESYAWTESISKVLPKARISCNTTFSKIGAQVRIWIRRVAMGGEIPVPADPHEASCQRVASLCVNVTQHMHRTLVPGHCP